MKVASSDLLELAEENDDDVTMRRAKQVRRLIFKMRQLAERLEESAF